MAGIKGKAGRHKSDVERAGYFFRLRPEVIARVDRCAPLLELKEGVRMSKAEALEHLLTMACEALERRREGREASVPDSISEISEISEDDMSVRSHGFPEDKEEMLVSQPAPASHRNGQGAPELAVPTAQVSEMVTESQNGEIVIPPYDATKYVLGKLCPQGHEWGTTGQSLLRLPSRNCPTCVNASKREKRAGRRQATLS